LIAPLRQVDRQAPTGLRHARKAVAALLLRSPSGAQGATPRFAPWKAWGLTIWIVLVMAAYAASLAGWW
jgi:hypothetical protein